VERNTGYVALRKLRIRRAAAVNAHAIRVFPTQPRPVYTVTVDNGTEFHEYAKLEQATATRFYFATPHHAWERGTNENTNGLLRQYLPKRRSMARLTQLDCHRIAAPAQSSAAQASGLPNSGGVLCPLRLSVALQS
jgi:IS30 family transposase